MDFLRTRNELARLDALRGRRPLVLVPTMGALHEGHLSLVRLGANAGPVVVSIFVNPTQFGPGEDFAAYPRELETDLALLEPLGVEAVFAPARDEIYGAEGEVVVVPGRRAGGLCGGSRPGHFGGVLTVVAKLFGLIRPDIAVFGRKDAQQCLVIGQMVEDLRMPVRLVDGTTVREHDGLAMSSRNRYLDPDQRRRALCLSQSLREARRVLEAGERRPETLATLMKQQLEPADNIEYAEIRSVPELETVERAEGRILLAVAATVGPARLIDNLVLEVAGDAVTDSCLLGNMDTIDGGR